MNLKDSWKDVKEFEDRRNRLETALYKWLETTRVLEDDIIKLIDNNNIPRKQIAKDMDIMESKLMVLKNNLKNY